MGLLEHLPHCRADPEERVSQLRETTRSQIRQTTNPEMPPTVPAIDPWKVTLISSTTHRRVPALRGFGVAKQASARKHNTPHKLGEFLRCSRFTPAKLSLCLWQPFFQIGNTNGIDGMSSQELGEIRGTGPALLIIGGEAFPKSHCFLRIVARPRHVNHSNVVGLRFLFSTVR